MNFYKVILTTTLVVSSFVASATEFVNPTTFDGSKAQKAQVIKYIEQNTHQTYCFEGSEMCNELTVSMMNKGQLDAFKWLTANVTDQTVFKQTLSTYCDDDFAMCNYITLKNVYVGSVKAKQDRLAW